VKQLRGRSIPTCDLISGDSTWEIEEGVQESYPNLFLDKLFFRTIFFVVEDNVRLEEEKKNEKPIRSSKIFCSS